MYVHSGVLVYRFSKILHQLIFPVETSGMILQYYIKTG